MSFCCTDQFLSPGGLPALHSHPRAKPRMARTQSCESLRGASLSSSLSSSVAAGALKLPPLSNSSGGEGRPGFLLRPQHFGLYRPLVGPALLCGCPCLCCKSPLLAPWRYSQCRWRTPAAERQPRLSRPLQALAWPCASPDSETAGPNILFASLKT